MIKTNIVRNVNQKLNVQLTNLLKEQFNLRIKKHSGKLQKTHFLRLIRKKISKINMLIKKDEIINNGRKN